MYEEFRNRMSRRGSFMGETMRIQSDAVVNAKNVAPTMNLQVQEDLTLAWGKTNTADIGQIVNFLVNVEVHAGAENYVIHTEKTSSFKNYFLRISIIVLAMSLFVYNFPSETSAKSISRSILETFLTVVIDWSAE